MKSTKNNNNKNDKKNIIMVIVLNITSPCLNIYILCIRRKAKKYPKTNSQRK